VSGLLDGKVAIVTGAARGIGRATATLLAGQGAAVVMNDLDADALAGAAPAIGSRVVAVPGDITDPAVPDALVARAVDELGGVDIVINNAGYTWDGVIHKLSDAQLDAMLQVHLVGAFRLLRAAGGVMREAAKRERDRGEEVFRKVVNVTSISGTMGNPGQANYAAAKAGLLGLTKTLAKEWGPLKINVNAVAFGFVETRLTAPADVAEPLERGGQAVGIGIPAPLRDAVFASIPLGRSAAPAEAAGAMFLLCTPWSDFLHGQVVTVAGGLGAGMES